jgi:hypothetical protein
MKQFLLFAIVLLFTLQPISAQEILQLDQLTSGELTPETPTASYFIALRSGQTLHLQAIAVTTGLVLQGTLSTANGTLVQNIPNPSNSAILEADLTASANGIFRLNISSASASVGQFVLVVQELEPLEPDAELELDEPVSGTLQPNETVAYTLTGDPTARLILDIMTDDPQAQIEVELLDADDEVVASLETQETGGELLIPAGREDYQLAVINPLETAVGFEVVLTSLDGPISTPIPQVTSLPAPIATTCTVTPLNVAVNVRRGPSTQFEAFMSMPPGAILTAVARNPEATWFQVNTGSGLGWVAGSVILTEGPCVGLPVVVVPIPTFVPPTETPTATPTSQATTVAVPQLCNPLEFTRDVDNGAYMVISLPRGSVGDTIFYRDGYHTQYVFPTCRAILWSSLNFTCSRYGEVTYWEMSANARFDWNATCGSNTNADQSGLSFGVR